MDNPKTEFFLNYLRNLNLTIPHGRMYYEAWPFLQYITDNPDNFNGFGQKFMQRVMSEAMPNEYPFDTIERLSGNDMKEVLGNFAKRMATLDFDRKSVFQEQLQIALQEPYMWQLIYTQLEKSPDKDGWYNVPLEKAPMQTGMNIIPLNIEGNQITVTLHGLSDAPDADWRACIVAEGANGITKYSPIFGEGTQSMTLDGTETALYLTVIATPDELIATSAFDKAEQGEQYSYTKGDGKRKFPYEVSISGASPMKRKINTDVAGHYHSNGGGFVADTAAVDDTVYVAPNAMVLGNSKVTGYAVIEDNAVVSNAVVSDYARISGYAVVSGNWWDANATVCDGAKVGDYAVISGNAKVSGNARVMENAFLLDNYQATDNATIKGTAHCYGSGIASDQAIIDGDFYNEISISHGSAFGWLESEGYQTNLPYTDGLYVGYDFSRKSTAYAYDKYGATNGMLRNNPLYEETRTSAEGVITFNGIDQYIVCDSTISDLNNIEISTSVLWRGGADEQKVFNFGRDSAEMYFTPSNENGVAEFVIRYGDIENKLTAEKPLTKGEWSVVRIILNGVTGKLIINSDVVAECQLTSAPDWVVGADSAYYIARGINGDYFNGFMDFFNVYYKESDEPDYYYTEREEIVNDQTVIGDVNNDGKFSIADVLLLQKWLLAVPGVQLINWEAGDLCEDDRLDVFDLCLMKRELLKQKNLYTFCTLIYQF